MRLLLLLCAVLCWPWTAGAQDDFTTWLKDFRAEAQASGISATALQQLDGLQFDAKVLRLDKSQPEHKITFAQYRKNVVSLARIRDGKRHQIAYATALRHASKAHGVPGAVILALWGVETSYGTLKGRNDVLRSVATLAYDGRRADYFRKELLAALKILDSHQIPEGRLLGSWAGAMGQCQFMPSTFLQYAVDGDGDGVKDIWDNKTDAFASIANYLKYEGWKPGQGWGEKVTLRRAVAADNVGVKQAGRPLLVWNKLGVEVRPGSKLADEKDRLYYLVQPDGAEGPSYLVTENYQALMRWNRSTYFATAVGLLADAIAQP